MDSKQEILNKMKNTFKNKIEIPGNVSYSKLENVITLTIKDIKNQGGYVGIRGNMQTDDSAFEAWCLAIRQGYPGYIIKLDWEEKFYGEAVEHFNRFLYRVQQFKALFSPKDNGWFQVDKDFSQYEFLKHYSDKQKKLYVNTLHNKPGDEIKQESPEQQLEVKFANPNNIQYVNELLGSNITIIPAKDLLGSKDGICFGRHLPIGMYEKPEGPEDAACFLPRTNAAIDLWGYSEERNEFYILELKTKDNRKAGIISELLFYTEFIQDLVSNRFEFVVKNPRNSYKLKIKTIFDRLKESAKSLNLKPTIVSCFLVEKDSEGAYIHPLLEEKVIQDMNTMFESNGYRIKFRIIPYESDRLK